MARVKILFGNRSIRLTLKEINQSKATGQSVVLYEKVQADSPYWCGYINDVIQYLVPPCWFGKPDPEPADLPAGFPQWCKHVPESVRDSVSPCAASSRVASATIPSSSGSSGLVSPALNQEAEASVVRYRKVQADSPYWCAYINDVIQYLVPPCWFGKPDPEPADVPQGRPDWCKHIPESAWSMVTACMQNSTGTS